MNEQFEKIKEHFKEHKTNYIIGFTAFIAGGVLFSRIKTIQNIEVGAKWKSPTTNVFQTTVVRRGHPGNVVRCIETGEIWPSQNLAAQRTGVNASHLAQHLNGKFDSVKDLHFEKLGEVA